MRTHDLASVDKSRYASLSTSMPLLSLFAGLAFAGILQAAMADKYIGRALPRLKPEKAPDRFGELYAPMNGKCLQVLLVLTMRRRSSPRCKARRHIKGERGGREDNAAESIKPSGLGRLYGSTVVIHTSTTGHSAQTIQKYALHPARH